MTFEQSDITGIVQGRLGSAALSVGAMRNNDLMIVVDRESIVSSVRLLKDSEELQFTTLMNHLGVDYGDRMAVIYNLYSPLLRRKLTIKAFLDRSQPEVQSLETLFPGIGWYERETFDMLGVRFIGHSNLKRLLLPEDWSGHPLRKDYVYPESYHGIDTGRTDLLDGPGEGGAPVV